MYDDFGLDMSAIALAERLKMANTVKLELCPSMALTVIGALQLALRHPQFPPITRCEVSEFTHKLIAAMAGDDQKLRDICLAGFDPRKDVSL